MLGRDPYDIDLVTPGPPEPLGRKFADSIGGSFFIMSGEFKTCRAISADGLVNYDFAALRGGHIVEDLGERDFTVNAMAVELPGGGRVIDPFGGGAHLAGRELVPINNAIFDNDPLRLLRAPRLEKTHELVIGPSLALLISTKAILASSPAAERIFLELSRILATPGVSASVARLDELGLLEVLLPELGALKGIAQNDYHHLDVFNHVLASVEALEKELDDPESFFPGRGDAINQRIKRRVAGDADCPLVLILAALFHDIAKPHCRFIDKDGQVRFFEHDRLGADLADDILTRLKVSNEARKAVTHLVRRHMRFEGLLQEESPSDRARLRYLKATEPWSIEAILLSVSDRLAVRGIRVHERDIDHHLGLARSLMEQAFAREETRPLPKLVSGDELMRDLGIGPGPLVGELLEQIQNEQELGNIASREQALSLAHKLASRNGESSSRPASGDGDGAGACGGDSSGGAGVCGDGDGSDDGAEE